MEFVYELLTLQNRQEGDKSQWEGLQLDRILAV